jgi:hypothetical protein
VATIQAWTPTMKAVAILLLVLLMTGCQVAGRADGPDRSDRPRIIVTTDLGADPDDEQSLVRFLVMSNEFEVEGLIVSTGCWKKNQNDTAMLDRIVDAYGEVLPNLQVHADGFPSHEYLRSISVMGQPGYGMSDVGQGRDSPGSELIIAAVDRDDPRPVWATCWGGCNTIAQSLHTVRATRSPAELDVFLGKLRVFDVLGQDDAGTWIARTFPDVLYIRATGVYGWAPSDEWIATKAQPHGPLGALYPDRQWATEGDTPAFLHVFPTGLNDPDRVEQGGWGGRFEATRKAGIRGMSCMEGEDEPYDPYFMYGNTAEGAAAIRRWRPAYDNDFEARMRWSVTSSYADANHHPVAVLNGDTSRRVLSVSAVPGSSVTLSAAGSRDPDGDSLVYSWSHDRDPGSYGGSVDVQDSASGTATIHVPSDASGTQIHILLVLHDTGLPNLYAYRRMVIDVQGR